MIIFGINLPLPELFLMLVAVFFIFLIMILVQLQRLKNMTSDEKKELEELEKLAQQEKSDLNEIKKYQAQESTDLARFEKELLELEADTDTLYLKKLAPDLFKIQNYTLWALKKGLNSKQIKENLTKKGWKDNPLIEMVIEDTLKYKGYYKGKKGNVNVPSVKIEETTRVIQPVKIVKVETPSVPKIPVKKSSINKIQVKKIKPSDDFTKIEKELKELEKNLVKEKKTSKRTTGKTSKKKVSKPNKSKTKKKATKKNSAKTSKKKAKTSIKKKTVGKSSNEGSVIVEAKKGTDVRVKYK